MIARRRFWGRGVLRTAVASMLAAPPACLALGFLGLWGPPRPWPVAGLDERRRLGGLSLETWRGWPAWILWIWTSLPGAVALVALATAAGPGARRTRPGWTPPGLPAPAGCGPGTA